MDTDNERIAERLFKRLQGFDDKKRIYPHYKEHFITLVVDELNLIESKEKGLPEIPDGHDIEIYTEGKKDKKGN